MTLRFGLVGWGRWGACHAEAIRREPGAELAAVAVSSAESARRVAAELGMPAFGDYREMLGRGDLGLDVVDVVAPNWLHGEIALAALEAGCHVLIEKPLATTLAACDAVLETARRRERVVAVGHELRLSPLWGRLKVEIDAGRIGRPLSCAIRLWRRSFRPGSAGWRHDPARVGSWILEEPIHFFDLARWYLAELGEPTAVYARAAGRQAELDDSLAAIVSFPNGGFAGISQTTAGAEHHLLAEVVGSDASLRLVWSGASDRSEEPAYRLEMTIGDEAREIVVDETPTETGDLRAEIAAVARCLAEGTSPPADGHDGRWAVRLCLASEESARTGQVVSF